MPACYRHPEALFTVLSRTTLVLALACALGGAFGASASAQPGGENLRIEASPLTGLANFVRAQDGGPIALPGQAAKQPRAIDFLRAYGNLFGVTDVDEQLVQLEERTDRIGYVHTTFRQTHRGVTVFSGMLKVHRDARGDFKAANGDFYPIPETFDITPRFSLDDAVYFAQGSIEGEPADLEQSELTIVDPGWYGDPPRGPRLAYYLILADPARNLREAFFVDALSGEILDQWTVNYHLLDRRVYLDSGALPGQLVRAEGDPPAGIFDADAAYDFAGDVYGFWERGFGRDSLDDMGLPLVLTVGETYACPNAYWSPPLLQSIYCAGVVTDDIVAHELMHGIIQETAGLIYQNESGQLNESYADVFGELVDLFNGGAAFAGTPTGSWPPTGTGPQTDTPNDLRTTCSLGPDYGDGVRWLIAEDSSALGGAIRDMWDPTCFDHPDKVSSPLQTCNPYDNGGVHSGSGIPNHAFAMLTDGKTFNGETVSAIGPIKAAAVWFRALSEYMTPATSFFEAALVLIQSANDLIGTSPLDPSDGQPSATFTSSDWQEVIDAMTAVEMIIGGAACRGSCCDQLAGTCEDYVLQADCAGDFSAGNLCAFLPFVCVAPSSSARMVLLLDRTGSMEAVTRISTGNTRCRDALEQAKLDLRAFMEGEPDRAVSVWTFGGSTVTELTDGFVDEATALAALDALDGENCTGLTPMVDALCAAVGAFPPDLPRPDKLLAISSDGEENNSSGPCAGPSSQIFPPPPGNYETGSWQKNVFDAFTAGQIVTVRHWGTFGIPAGGDGDDRIDVETGLPAGPVSGDAVFFADLVAASGGGGSYTEMKDDAPAFAIVPTLRQWMFFGLASLLLVIGLFVVPSRRRLDRSHGRP